MARKGISELSEERLLRRKKLIGLLNGVVMVTLLFYAGFIGYLKLFSGESFQLAYVAPFLGLLASWIPLKKALKELRKELEKRNLG